MDELFAEQLRVESLSREGDLTSEINWSYSDEEKTDYIQEDVVYFKNIFAEDASNELPDEFKIGSNKRPVIYWKNRNGYTDLKVLIRRDSSIGMLMNTLATYFKEIIFSWDHWEFNEDFIEWYKPDIILEIRTERFLEHMKQFI